MLFFDLHCDTLYKAFSLNKTLDEDSFDISVSRGKRFKKWCECMAVWLPDDIAQEEALKLFQGAYCKLLKEAERFGISVADNSLGDSAHNFLFTVENGAFLDGNLDNIQLLSDCSVRMITLTWNAENCIGGGADTPEVGLKPFGRACVEQLEKASIVIDISHASDRLFYDVLEHTQKPIVASHSNSRSICNHRRNITDDQFIQISQRNGLVGLNFHRDFLSETPSEASVKDVLLNAEHFLSLGGEDVLSIGSDYDGSDVPKTLKGIEKIGVLYEEFLKIGYNEQLVQKILYYNAHNFFSRF